MELNEWAQAIAEERLRERERSELAARKALSDREMLQRAAPEVWAQVSARVLAAAAALEAALGDGFPLRIENDSSGARLSLCSRRNGAEVYELHFQAGTLQIVTTEEFYRVELRGASEVVLLGKKGAVTVERVARDAVSAALKQCEL